MCQRNPQDVNTWDYWDPNRGYWRGDASISVRVSSVANGRSMFAANGTEIMNDTETEDDFNIKGAESKISNVFPFVTFNGTKLNSNTDTEDTFYLTNRNDTE